MRLIPVSLAVFYKLEGEILKVWTQTRVDDGPFHGLLEFPGGGIEEGETPLTAAVREVEEEVGISIEASEGRFLGTYPNVLSERTILLYVTLFPPHPELESKGEWLLIKSPELSCPFQGMIPYPNHKIIDDLFLALLS